MDDHGSDDATQGVVKSRRRTAYACVSCRARKIRCDGQEQCNACSTLGIECRYNHETTSTKGKSDLILNSILRLEQTVSNIDLSISALRQDVSMVVRQPVNQYLSPPPQPNRSAHADGNAVTIGNRTTSFSGHSPRNDVVDEFSNATISEHTSTAEAILHWPVFDSFRELRQDDVLKSGTIFWMENARQRHIQPNSVIHLLSEDELDGLINAFSHSINFSYPVVLHRTVDHLRYHSFANDLDHSTRTCLMLLIMALGCAAATVALANDLENQDQRRLTRLRSLGRVYFDAAVARLHAAYCTINPEAIQCFALTALYFAYLQRPLQAWSMLNSAATACRVMMSYNVLDADGSECVRRVFWMCFILESDYLAELPALPRFGIADIESNVPLPGNFESHKDSEQNDLSSLYFLACISMRRLLNRCHHLLFGQQEARKRDSQRLSAIVAELDQQLEDWRQLLPPAFQFSVDVEPVSSQHGAFLRQRYLTCRALIHRPYVMKATSDYATTRSTDETTVLGARKCLSSSILHILNLRPFNQTVLVDTWICSLSMAGTMMVLLVAFKTASLSEWISHDISVVGPHLISLFENWIDVHGEEKSPSVHQATKWIKVIDGIIRNP